VRRGDISIEQAEAELDQFNARLQTVLDEVRTVPVPSLDGVPVGEIPEDLDPPPTGVDRATLLDIARVTMTAPEGFTIHPKLERQFVQRQAMLDAGEVDWALGEALAFGTLVKVAPTSGSWVRTLVEYLFAPPRRAH